MFDLALTVILAQQTSDWWATPLGQNVGYVLSILAAIGILAAAVKGTRYLVDQGLIAKRWTSARSKARRHREDLLDEMLSPEGWPALKREVGDMSAQLADVHTLVNSKMTAALARIDELETLLTDRDEGIH